MKLSVTQKDILLNLVFAEIKDHLGAYSQSQVPAEDEQPELYNKCGAFVTLYVNHQLRGCIGTFSEEQPLIENTRRMAIQSAFHDTRFNPINENDLDRLDIEISVLTPRRRIFGPEEIEIGTHGIYIESQGRRGTFLPQVATSHNLDAVSFLELCCENKMGLPGDAWKNADLFVFEALILR